MDTAAKIYVAGHTGLVGTAIVRALHKADYKNILTRTHHELDLTRQSEVEKLLSKEKPDYIFMAAAKVGGIAANEKYSGEFIYKNLMIDANIIEAARQVGVKRLLNLNSSCIYPRQCTQPMTEDFLMTGPLEYTNEAFAVAKLAGIKMCENYNKQYKTEYVSLVSSNVYGPNDNYNLENSHVLPALIRKTHDAKLNKNESVMVWGSGNPRREFLYVDDLAEACVFMMKRSDITGGVFNIGTGKDISIRELAETIMGIIGYSGNLKFDSQKQDGTPQKLLNTNKIESLGWKAKTKLKDGLAITYKKYKESTYNKH